jgi:hypothetical protein
MKAMWNKPIANIVLREVKLNTCLKLGCPPLFNVVTLFLEQQRERNKMDTNRKKE